MLCLWMFQKSELSLLILSCSRSCCMPYRGLSLAADTHLQLWYASPRGESLRVGHSLYYDRGMLGGSECFHLSLCHCLGSSFSSFPFHLLFRLCASSFHLFPLLFHRRVFLFPSSCLFWSLICYNLLLPKLPDCYESPGPLQLYCIETDSSPHFWQFISIFVSQNRTFMSLQGLHNAHMRVYALPLWMRSQFSPPAYFFPSGLCSLMSSLDTSSPIHEGLIWLAVWNHFNVRISSSGENVGRVFNVALALRIYYDSVAVIVESEERPWSDLWGHAGQWTVFNSPWRSEWSGAEIKSEPAKFNNRPSERSSEQLNGNRWLEFHFQGWISFSVLPFWFQVESLNH